MICLCTDVVLCCEIFWFVIKLLSAWWCHVMLDLVVKCIKPTRMSALMPSTMFPLVVCGK